MTSLHFRRRVRFVVSICVHCGARPGRRRLFWIRRSAQRIGDERPRARRVDRRVDDRDRDRRQWTRRHRTGRHRCVRSDDVRGNDEQWPRHRHPPICAHLDERSGHVRWARHRRSERIKPPDGDDEDRPGREPQRRSTSTRARARSSPTAKIRRWSRRSPPMRSATPCPTERRWSSHSSTGRAGPGTSRRPSSTASLLG